MASDTLQLYLINIFTYFSVWNILVSIYCYLYVFHYHCIHVKTFMSKKYILIDVCIWFSVAVTVWGVCGNVCCVVGVVKDSVLTLEW